MQFRHLAFVAAPQEEAQDALRRLQALYPHVAAEQADLVVALGGDGFMLRTLHQFMEKGVPIYGMNRGTVGFLMNEYREEDLPDRLKRARAIRLRPLRMVAQDIHGRTHQAVAVNEVSLLRETRQAAKIRILVDGVERMEELVCDGALVATPAGSTAYNNAVHGTILPLEAQLVALTPISAFRPRRWRGALLPHGVTVVFEILHAEERRVSAVADHVEVRDVARVEVREDAGLATTLLFDPEHSLEERILKEQFLP
ncbi:MAG: NAD kinase [Magnetospirillum sp. WYHS-4]